MEVAGKRQDTNEEKASQGKVEEYCNPCGCDGQHVPADGFCKTCGDYLCADCFKVHTIPRPCRNHVLLDRANMPRSAPRKPKSTCTIVCPDHHDKVIEFFCPTHNVVLCGVCAVLQHTSCNIMYIPDLAANYKESEEFKGLIESLNCLDTNIKSLSTDINDALPLLAKTSEKALYEIRRFRKEINDYLDKKEEELIGVTRKMEQDDTKTLQDIAAEMDCLKLETSRFRKQLKSVDAEISDLFVTSKQLTKAVQTVINRFTKGAEKNKKVQFTFKRGQMFSDVLSSNADLGLVERNYETKNVNYSFKTAVVDFKSKTIVMLPDVTESARITGLALLPPHNLIMADKTNSCVKSVDITNNTIMSSLSLSNYPWDITTLPPDKAAVTIPNAKKIQIISTKDILMADRIVNVDGSCHGICTYMDKLIVSFCYPGKVEIIDFQGKVFVSLKADQNGDALFLRPEFLTVVEENWKPVIHVSDINKNTITKISMNGQVLSTYTKKNWKGIDGLAALGDGQLLVCTYYGNTVDVVSEGGKKIETLLESSQKIRFPESICYCADQNKLFVSCFISKAVRAYKFITKNT